MTLKWTSYRRGEDFEDAVSFPRGCQEQYLAHPGHAGSTLEERGIFLSGISRFVTPYLVQRRNPGYHVLLLTTGGTGELNSEDTIQDVKRGDLLIAPSRCQYSYRAKGPWNCVWFHVSDDADWGRVLPQRVLKLESRYLDLLTVITNQYMSERQSRLADSQSALQSLADLIVLLLDRELRQLPQGRKDMDVRRRLDQLWKAVHSNLAHAWTTDSLAAEMGISPAQFNRIVKRFHKATPMSVVTSYRMTRAREMLTFTEHTLEAIAVSVGYETAFSFSRAFKRHIGKSPSDFRRAIQKE